MKNLIYIVLSGILGLYGCSSQKKLETSPPFTLGTATSQKWAGGREESGSGEVIKITVKEMTGEEVTLQNIYFKGTMSEVVMEMEGDGMMATAKFHDKKPDMIMHADSTMEVGNQPPELKSEEQKEFPFDLKETEAVLSYLENDKVKYVKIIGIVNKPARIYPGRPQN
jgi:hypothetical protein